MKKVDWCVNSGPDERHLIDCKFFSKLKDARDYINSLPNGRYYRLERCEINSPLAVFSDVSMVAYGRVFNNEVKI